MTHIEDQGTSDDEPSDRGLLTRESWDAAVRAGGPKPEMVLERLHGITIREFGEMGPIGYDEDGFVVSLVADGIRIEGGARLVVHTRDHQPPHVHVQRPDEQDIVISLLTGEVLHGGQGVRRKQLAGYQKAVTETHYPALTSFWEKAHGPLVSDGQGVPCEVNWDRH